MVVPGALHEVVGAPVIVPEAIVEVEEAVGAPPSGAVPEAAEVVVPHDRVRIVGEQDLQDSDAGRVVAALTVQGCEQEIGLGGIGFAPDDFLVLRYGLVAAAQPGGSDSGSAVSMACSTGLCQFPAGCGRGRDVDASTCSCSSWRRSPS